VSRPRFVLTPQARADLVAIWNYIAEDSPENADRVLERLYGAFTRLAETRSLPSFTEPASWRLSSRAALAGRLPRQPNESGAFSRPWRRGWMGSGAATGARCGFEPADPPHVCPGARGFLRLVDGTGPAAVYARATTPPTSIAAPVALNSQQRAAAVSLQNRAGQQECECSRCTFRKRRLSFWGLSFEREAHESGTRNGLIKETLSE
jgi:plasmid stabilization system protein ParE